METKTESFKAKASNGTPKAASTQVRKIYGNDYRP
jgi:hypothetical protein